jgi:hypothetical protein
VSSVLRADYVSIIMDSEPTMLPDDGTFTPECQDFVASVSASFCVLPVCRAASGLVLCQWCPWQSSLLCCLCPASRVVM